MECTVLEKIIVLFGWDVQGIFIVSIWLGFVILLLIKAFKHGNKENIFNIF